MSEPGRDQLSKLARTSAIYVASAAISAAIPLLLIPILTRILGPVEYGVVGAFTALAGFASVLAGLGTHGYVSVKYFQGDRNTFGSAVGASAVVLAGTTLLLTLILTLGSRVVSDSTGVTPNWQWTIVVAAAGQFALTLAQVVWQVRGLAVRFSAAQILGSILNMAVTLGLVAWAGFGWEGRALAVAVVAGGLGAACLTIVARDGDMSLSVRWTDIRASLEFGIPLTPHLLICAAMASMDRLVLAGAVGPYDAGMYFVAFQISSLLTMFAAAVNQAWTPWLYGILAANDPASKRRVVRVTYAIFALFTSAAATLGLLGSATVQMVAGEQFAPAARLLPILAAAAALNSMYYFVANYIFFASRTKLMSVITALVAVFQIAMTLLFVSKAGALGVALATLLSAATYFAAVWFAASRLVDMPWSLRSTR